MEAPPVLPLDVFGELLTRLDPVTKLRFVHARVRSLLLFPLARVPNKKQIRLGKLNFRHEL
jgi:hypothetical protein